MPTGLRLLSFAASRQNGAVVLTWETGSEVGTFGFTLWRSGDGQRSSAERITPELILATGRSGGGSYVFSDRTAEAVRTYTYWLEEVRADGSRVEYSPIVSRAAAPYRLFMPMMSQ